jgi:hypothetical protein
VAGMDGWVSGEASEVSKGKPGGKGRASIHYEPKGVRLLILTLTLRIVLSFFGTIVATLRIQKIR